MQTVRTYDHIFDFIDKYEEQGFDNIADQDPFIKTLNTEMDRHNQFFFIGDMLKYQILYTSPQIQNLYGISPDNFNPGYLLTKVHPSDILRLSRGRSKQMEKAQLFYIYKAGSVVLSSNFKFKNFTGDYANTLIQCYIFYSKPPRDTVYIVHLHTPFKKGTAIPNGRFHWYLGPDTSLFRYPDKELLKIGSLYSNRELEIMAMIYEGMETKEIGEKLFLSAYTISTHRKNILKKSGRATILEVIYELKTVGIL